MLEFYAEDFPAQCILDCSMPGRDAAPHVREWLSRIGLAVDPVDVAAALREYGAWDEEELRDAAANRERLLWVVCCDFAYDGPDGGAEIWSA